MISRLPSREHVRHFRQDSWQWDYLHIGRCTTSQTPAALGFLEPKAAGYLGIPRSLRRGGVGAWDRLQQVPEDDQSLESIEQILCEGRAALDNNHNNDNGDEEDWVGKWRPGAKESERMWIPASHLSTKLRTRPYPFTAKYIPNLTHEELYRRKLYLERHHNDPSPMKARMQWGNAQEATSILTALNYFCAEDDRTMIREVGMCGAAFDDEMDEDNNSLLQGVKIGASPDAIICHGNGTVEVLEVKNHCPFVWNRISPHYTQTKKSVSSKKKKKKGNNKKKGGRRGKKNNSNRNIDDDDDDDDEEEETPRGNTSGLPKHYLIRDFKLETRVPPQYIPQLMMEMLCVGNAVDLDNKSNDSSANNKPICTSAIMVRQTATRGAILLRLQRDEEWIQEMKYWLGKFQNRYVETGDIPDDNFFWDDNPNSRYRKFLQRTKEISERVEHVAFIDHAQIQRMVLERDSGGDSTIPLFLDRIRGEEA